ncbi:MAG: hypothetical protein R3B46_06175 [Phycisphaerales bacterium]
MGDPAAGDVIRAAIYPNTVQGFEQAAAGAQIIGEVGDESAVAQLIRIVERTRSRACRRPARTTTCIRRSCGWRRRRRWARLGYPTGGMRGERTGPTRARQLAGAGGTRWVGRGWGVMLRLNGMLGDPDKRVRVAAAGGILNAIERPTRPKPRGG